MANPKKGDTAREMASAPLPTDTAVPVVPPAAVAGNDIRTAMESAIIADMVEKQAETLTTAKALPFTFSGTFKLNGKAKDYTNDDGSTSRKVAFAIMRIGDSAFTFDAAINVVSTLVTSGEHKGKTRREFTCKFPNKGKNEGYKPLFETDNPVAERELAILRVAVTNDYRAWAKTLETAPERMQGRKHGEDSVVEIGD